MSKITTNSRFFYGTTVSILNRSIDFDEGGGELQATLKVGAYSLTEYAAEVQRALREAGSQAYTVTLNRTTRKLTIAAPLAFDLLTNTGTRAGSSAWVMMGFTTVADHTGATSYLAENGAGSEYVTQWPVDQYLAEDDNIVKENATVNMTPAGIVQMIDFGDGRRVQMNIRLITNQQLYDSCANPSFVYNAAGVAAAKALMTYLLTKGRVEFMPDKDTQASFTKCFLESSADDRNGTSYELKNMKTPDVYETGRLTFRKVLV